MPDFDTFADTARAVEAVVRDASVLGDDELLAAIRVVANHRKHTDLIAARLASELARRSTRHAGHSGLAQRQGFGGAESFLQSVTPLTRAEATQLVRAGALMAAAEPLPLWQRLLSDGLNSGRLSVPAADPIRAGLDQVGESAPAVELLAACQRLLDRAPHLSVDELRREARAARDRLDQAGISRRECRRRDLRYLKRWVRDDGMYQGTFLLDPESGQHVFSALDAITAPRREVRFSESIPVDGGVDSRTDEQILADALVDVVRLAVDADPGTLFGSRRPAVRVVVTESTLAGPGGHGYFEGEPQPVSRDTVDRYLCDTGMLGIKFDRRQKILDLGRTQRLFSEPQRITISVHDGLLLCRHHHLLLHNNHWRIVRDDDGYWLIPPLSIDPAQVRRRLRSKSALMREISG